ncbi:hypothetical protein HY604_02605 [Candidatus Peregrinibacteria bacterium]|nr:hypothetical protein [Candidatus Peregrinibacteria bacterium]
MTTKEIKIGLARPSISPQHEIALELEAALVELDIEDDIGIAIPNVTFQVRINVDNVFEGRSDAKYGVFKTGKMRIAQPTPELQIEVTASDGIDTIVKELCVDIAEEIARMEGADAIDAEEKRRIKAEIRQVQRDIKEKKAEIEQIRAAFGVLNKYSDHPLAAEVALEIADIDRTHADATIETYLHFKNAPWAEEVMFKAVTRAPLAVLGNIAKIKGEKWAARIVSMIAKWLPEDAIDYLPDYCEMPWAFQIMLQIAEENPRDVFAGIENYEYQPWAKAVAERAARTDYQPALEYYDLYKYQPWAQEIHDLAEGAKREEKARDAEHDRILEEARRLERERRAAEKRRLEEEERQAAEAKRVERDRQADKEARRAEDAEIAAAIHQAGECLTGHRKTRNPRNVYYSWQTLSRYAEEPETKRIVLTICAQNPETIIAHFHDFQKASWAQTVRDDAERRIRSVEDARKRAAEEMKFEELKRLENEPFHFVRKAFRELFGLKK